MRGLRYERACGCHCRGYGYPQAPHPGQFRHGVYWVQGRSIAESLDSTRGSGVFRRFVRLDLVRP